MRDNPDLSSYILTWYPVLPWKILQRGLVDDENVRQVVVLSAGDGLGGCSVR